MRGTAKKSGGVFIFLLEMAVSPFETSKRNNLFQTRNSSTRPPFKMSQAAPFTGFTGFLWAGVRRCD